MRIFASFLSMALLAAPTASWAQDGEEEAAAADASPEQPAAQPAPAAPPPPPAPTTEPEPAAAPEADGEESVQEVPGGEAVLRLYVVTTRNTYARFDYDIYNANTGDLVESGTSPDVAQGDEVSETRLAPGTYKIVRRGDSFDTVVDFATVEVRADTLTDYIIVVDPDSFAFRGSGVVTGELPKGVKLGGFRIGLTGGAGANLGYRKDVVGTTPGLTSQLSVFGNFSMLYDSGPHHLQVSSDINLTLTDPAFGKPYSSFDAFQADALYSFNINNKYIGPYARASFLTRVYPGYLYLDDSGEGSTVDVNINRNGTVENRTYGTDANLDDLRIKLSKPFGPFVLQEELGANLKAFDVDLVILQANIGTRIGYGFRQGFTQDLLVIAGGKDEGTPITLNQKDNYYTHGPVIGATGSVTFARWLYGAAQFGMMVPLQDREEAGDDFGERLLIDFAGTAGLKLPSFTDMLYASFDYTFRLTRDGYLTGETQFDQVLMARLNLKVF